MSPGQIMERVYDALKYRITRAVIPPGSRIDPVKMAGELAASATPVRDALHRLVGERIVQAWPQEGFHAALLTEAGLRDLYEWQNHLLGTILHTARSHPTALPAGSDPPPANVSLDECIGILFLHIATTASNREVRHALASTVERLAAARFAEQAIFDAQDAEYLSLLEMWQSGDHSALRLALTHYHRRRVRAVASIMAAIPSWNQSEPG